MRIETRIAKCPDKKDGPVEMSWNVEWRKNCRKQWKKYANAYSISEAEALRKLCVENRGEYPVVYSTKKNHRKYKVTQDFKFSCGSYNIYAKRPFERWRFNHLKYDLGDAIRDCDEMAEKGWPKDQVRTGVLKLPHAIAKTVESCVLCIRYPFLYPRNRWTGKHYTNWELDERIKKLFGESHECTNPVDFHKGMTEDELRQMKHPKYRITSFPKAAKCRILKIYRGILETLHCVPTCTEMDDMDEGWRKAFGKQMLKEVKAELKRSHLLKRYRIMQIKEKWGELCWYDNGGTDELFKILRKYEGISYTTCIDCGRPAKYRTKGWIVPVCENCISRENLENGRYTVIEPEGSFWKEIDPEDSAHCGDCLST